MDHNECSEDVQNFIPWTLGPGVYLSQDINVPVYTVKIHMFISTFCHF